MNELTKFLENYGIAGIHPAAGRYRWRPMKSERINRPAKLLRKHNSETIQLQGIVDKKIVQVPYSKPLGKHQFYRTNDAVDWARWTWNPVTGCLHGCAYCYARELAYRDSYASAYPTKFAPLFHPERLEDPVNKSLEPQRRRMAASLSAAWRTCSVSGCLRIGPTPSLTKR